MNQQTQQPINLTLSAQQVQYMLSVLAKRPYEEAAELISAIVNQANQQAAPAPEQQQQAAQTEQPKQTPAKVVRGRKSKANGSKQPTMQ